MYKYQTNGTYTDIPAWDWNLTLRRLASAFEYGVGEFSRVILPEKIFIRCHRSGQDGIPDFTGMWTQGLWTKPFSPYPVRYKSNKVRRRNKRLIYCLKEDCDYGMHPNGEANDSFFYFYFKTFFADKQKCDASNSSKLYL